MKKIIFALVALGTAATAQADIIPTLTTSSPVQVGDLFQYTYTATLAADQSLQTGNFFTIYDFQGFAGFGTVASGFTGTTSLLGRTPSRVNAIDNPSIFNATFTYSGPTLNMPMDGGEGVSTRLGSFQILSRFSGVGLIDFASQAVKNSGFATGTLVDNVGSVGGPLSGGGAGSGVPEPSAWAMLIIGFGAVGVAARRRRPNVVTA